MLIRKDMDELFERQTPAAVRRHFQGKYLDFVEIDGRYFFDGKRNQIGGIDGGLMLLEPSIKDFHRMESQLATGLVPGKILFTAPEQDYLTRYYVEGYTNYSSTAAGQVVWRVSELTWTMTSSKFTAVAGCPKLPAECMFKAAPDGPVDARLQEFLRSRGFPTWFTVTTGPKGSRPCDLCILLSQVGVLAQCHGG